MKVDPARLTKLLCADAAVWIRANGDSMGRRYQGEVAFLVEKLEAQRPRMGEILLRQLSDGTIVAHRCILVIRRHGTLRYYLRGDNNRSVDPSIVPGEETVGRAMRARVGEREWALTGFIERRRGQARAMMSLGISLWRKLRFGNTRPQPN